MALVTRQAENRFLMFADWATYEKLLQALEGRNIRITYDRGKLELMSPSYDHERAKTALAALLEMVLVDSGLDFEAGGSTTFRVEALERGIEPDECYWVRNAQELHGLWKTAEDPFPDLAIEVEMSRSAIDRLGIFSALGVAEVWRLTRDLELKCHRLAPGGRYEESSSSGLLPHVPLAELERFVRRSQEVRLGTLLREFRDWLGDQAT